MTAINAFANLTFFALPTCIIQRLLPLTGVSLVLGFASRNDSQWESRCRDYLVCANCSRRRGGGGGGDVCVCVCVLRPRGNYLSGDRRVTFAARVT